MREQPETTGATTTRMVDAAPLLDLALHMADRADEVALAGFGRGITVDFKADGSPVTRVDREVESILRDTIEREHPRAGIIGEEYGEEPGVGRWIIDPIDGTREFVKGDPRFSVLIAYEMDGAIQAGVVSAPALELRWWAGNGLGARRSYRSVVSAARVSIAKRMSRAQGMVLGGFHTNGWPDPAGSSHVEESLLAQGARLNRRGVSWEAVRVAGGEFDFALTSGYVWDVAPLPVIIREAGGCASVVEADDGLCRLMVSNRQLADQLSGFAP